MYKLKQEEKGLRYKRSALLLWYAWPMRLIGLLLLPAVPALAIDSSQDIIVILAGMGLFLFSASFLMTAYLRSLPASFFLNKENAQLEICSATAVQATIPFTEIVQPLIRREQRRYVLYIERRGGSRLDLISFSSLNRARKNLEILEDALKPVASAGKLKPDMPSENDKTSLEIQRLPGSTLFSWQDRLSILATLWIVMLLGGASLILYGSVRSESHVAALIVLSVLAIFLIYAGLSLLRSFFCRPGLEINSDRIQAVYLWRYGGKIALRKSRHFSLSRLHALHCHFEPGRGVQKLLLLDQDEVRSLQEMTVQLSYLPALIKLHWKMFQIPLYGLPLTGALELEGLLRREIFVDRES
ncbi:MAG: hypothetical protein HS115_00410 [Spirochaetales bacterium]|nr:hypothetical protein [Spirochaetales bacterium]